MKNNFFSKIASFICLIAIVCVSVVFSGCDSNLVYPDGKKNLVESDYKIVDNGMSEYQIVLADSPKSNESIAAEELQLFIKRSSGAVLPIVSESKVSQNTPMISIGETIFAQNKGISVSDEDLGSSAYKIKTDGASLFILSDRNGNGEGCIYAVYDVLEDAIGWCAYASDEIDYEEKKDIKLYVYDEIVKPTFDRRSIAYLDINSDAVYRRRMRLINQYNNDFWCNPLFGHSQISDLLKKEDYYEAHKYGVTKKIEIDGETVEVADHWYATSDEQLCWTGGAEMEQEMATVLYKYIQQYPYAVYFMLGQEDNKEYCTCERCQKAISEWGYNITGLEINFLNNVIKIVDEWVKRDYPEGRDLKYVMFAYYDAIKPPITGDEGNETAFSEKVIPDSKLYVYFTPIETDYSHSLEAVENEDVLKNLQGWYKLLGGQDRLIVYSYDTNFRYYFYNFNNFGTFKAHLKTYSENGVNYYYSQGAPYTNQCTLQEMRIFVESKLMWNVDLSYDDLVNQFMNAYYKDAATAVRKYYDFTRMRYEQCEEVLGMTFLSIYANIGSREIWTEEVVSALDRIFDEAYKSIEHYKTEDPSLYDTLKSRVKRLELMVIYTKLYNYNFNYSQAELNVLVDDFNKYTSKFQILDYQENGGSCSGMFDSYRQ